MQIHEINPLREGLVDRIKSLAKSATTPQPQTPTSGNAALDKLRSQGYGQPRSAPNASDILQKVKTNPRLQQYAKQMAQQWMQQAQTLSITPATIGAKSAQPRPGAATPASAVKPAAAPAVSVGGQKLNPKNPQDARVLAALKSQGKLEEAFANLPGGSQAVPAPQQYLAKFREWANKSLRTRDPTTYQYITIDQIERDPVIGPQLKKAQGQVVAANTNPAQLQAALEDYVLTAVAGLQKITADNRVTDPATTVSSSTTNTQSNTISKTLGSMGINPGQLRATGQQLQKASNGNRALRPTGDPSVDAYLRMMGYQVL